MKITSIIKLVMLVGFSAGAVQNNANGATNHTPTQGVTARPTATTMKASNEALSKSNARMAWWRKAKFGLFIHWAFIPYRPVIITANR